MDNLSTILCPKCDAVCTPWGNDFYVCDMCGYGKDSDDKPIRSPFGKQKGERVSHD